jgi:hypothetical protein
MYSIIDLLHCTRLFQSIHRCTSTHRTTAHALDSTHASTLTSGRVFVTFIGQFRHVCMPYPDFFNRGARHYSQHYRSLGSPVVGYCARRCQQLLEMDYTALLRLIHHRVPPRQMSQCERVCCSEKPYRSRFTWCLAKIQLVLPQMISDVFPSIRPCSLHLITSP